VKFCYTTPVRAGAKPNDLFIRFKSRCDWPSRHCGTGIMSECQTIIGLSEDPSSSCGGHSPLIQFPAIALIYGDEDVNYITGKQLSAVDISGGSYTCSCTQANRCSYVNDRDE
jgi:hypothetical protein